MRSAVCNWREIFLLLYSHLRIRSRTEGALYRSSAVGFFADGYGGVAHVWILPPPSPPVSCGKFLIFNGMRRVIGCKPLILLELFVES